MLALLAIIIALFLGAATMRGAIVAAILAAAPCLVVLFMLPFLEVEPNGKTSCTWFLRIVC
jgi:hypothetical protein